MSDVYKVVQAQRERFIVAANGEMRRALDKQMQPVISASGTISDAKKLEGLISSEPIRIAFKKIYFKVGIKFAKASYEALLKMTGKDNFRMSFQIAVNSYLKMKGGDLIKGITDTTKERLNNFLKEQHEGGKGIEEIKRNMIAHFEEINANRARTIAITETNRASSWATIQGANMTGVSYMKRWVQTPAASAHPRADHSNIQDVAKDKDFDVNGYPATAPQDPDLPPEESVNCHCTVQLYRRR